MNNELVCRRTADLAVVWSHAFDPGQRAGPLQVSAHGEYVAGVISSGYFGAGGFAYETPLYIAVYDGSTGIEATRLALTPEHGFGLSRDGRLLAVPVEVPGEKGALITNVRILDTFTGVELASVFHSLVPNVRHQFLLAGCGASFTGDGEYLITERENTKVWQMVSRS